MTPTAAVADVCEVNPTLRAKLAADDLVGFVGMADLDAEAATATDTEVRVFSDLKGYTPFERGDILVAKITPCFENRKTGQATTSTPVAFGSTEFHVLRPHNDAIDARYLLHFLRRDAFLKLGEMRMTGAGGQRRVPARIFAELVIPLPPLGEQQRIAGVLDAADELRAKRRLAVVKLDTLTQAIFIDMFGDPASDSRWPALTLQEVCEAKGEYGANVPSQEQDGGRPRYLRITDITDEGRLIDDAVAPGGPEEDWCAKTLHPGDLVFARSGATVGKTFLTRQSDEPLVFAGYLIRFIPDQTKALPEYIYQYTRTQPYRAWVDSTATTVAQPNLNAKKYGSLKLPVPSLEMQQRFLDVVEQIRQRRDRARMSLDRFDELFASLQQRAFRGEL